MTVSPSALRQEVIDMAREMDDTTMLQRVRDFMKECFGGKAKANDEEYISKEEILDDIRESLIEIREAKREGRKLPLLKDLLNEVRGSVQPQV